MVYHAALRQTGNPHAVEEAAQVVFIALAQKADRIPRQATLYGWLFRNARGKPGLRVRLEGPQGNPHGIGAAVRLKFGPRFGPAREIHGGSGYWSQDSTVQVMGVPSDPTQIWVRWPGGRSVTADLPPKAREVVVNLQGEIRRTR